MYENNESDVTDGTRNNSLIINIELPREKGKLDDIHDSITAESNCPSRHIEGG